MVHAVIMAGGSGTRFWPESRKSRPKQLLQILENRTMIRATVERILPLAPFERIMVVTAASHAEEIIGQLPELSDTAVVSEPQGRNTAPCIALAAYKLAKYDPEGVMVALPADHLIGKEKEFLEHLRVASEAAAEEDFLITLGIKPNRPETGYGYIKLGAPAFDRGSVIAYFVEKFVEKPDLATAQRYLEKSTYMWNSGMFVWNVSTIIRAFEKYLPTISRAMEGISSALNTPEEASAVARIYEKIESISIDNGIMELAENVLVIPMDVDWNDVGSWESVQDIWDKDVGGNAIRGEVLALNSKGCVVSSPHKLTAIVGVEDLIVVDTPDAILVCRKDKAQDVKNLQTLITERGYGSLL
jgi:mannose-1-phosphate guanylyltransferase